LSFPKAARLIVSLALIAWVAWQTDWPRLGAAFARLRLGWWLAAVGLLIVTQLISTRRWQLLARALGFRRDFGQLVQYYFVGMYFNLLLPTSVGGDVVRAWYLDGGSGRRLPALGTVLLDRLCGLLALVALACLAVLLSPRALPAWLPWSFASVTCGILLGLALLPVVARLSARVGRSWAHLQSGMTALRSPRLLGAITLLSLFVQAANVGIVWLVTKSLQAPIPTSYLWLVVPLVSLLTLLPISINGMGVREGALVVLLAPIGVGGEIAVSVALLWFGVFLAVSLLGGGVYLLGRRPLPAAECQMPTANSRPPSAGIQQEDRHGFVDRDSDQGRARQLETAA